ncbi:uncharacterized protein M421DRAFT_96724 [Didymella exigua CBS 183.55]|uniref:Uncharacterized protein n=1 Tax=Didymella exigua CBS 183.55 TaxID=1150837 RepID=A0A6A5R9Q3_9PLEO|nr:uncharacterized protein M421DRAFT_96724 [Didymella exigua CBS 183.55]KAF1922567.1 hypothetical protein M421DRAFT_96724 [Didymella exigua CBS 183.55]
MRLSAVVVLILNCAVSGRQNDHIGNGVAMLWKVDRPVAEQWFAFINRKPRHGRHDIASVGAETLLSKAKKLDPKLATRWIRVLIQTSVSAAPESRIRAMCNCLISLLNRMGGVPLPYAYFLARGPVSIFSTASRNPSLVIWPKSAIY